MNHFWRSEVNTTARWGRHATATTTSTKATMAAAPSPLGFFCAAPTLPLARLS